MGEVGAPISRILTELQPLADVSGLLPVYGFNRETPKESPEPLRHVNTCGCFPLLLKVQTEKESLKLRYGHQNNILQPAGSALNPGESIEWTWPWTFRYMDQRLLALLAPRGQRLEPGLLCIPGITAGWLPEVTQQRTLNGQNEGVS